MIFIARPVFPMVTSPILDPSESDGVRGHTTGFGDIEMFTLFGPNRVDGVVWGIGSTFRFPTATSDRLGQGKDALFAHVAAQHTRVGTVVPRVGSELAEDLQMSVGSYHHERVPEDPPQVRSGARGFALRP